MREDDLGRRARGTWREIASALARRVPTLTEAYRLAKSPRQQLEVWNDYLQTRNSTRLLRNLQVSGRPGQTALVICLSEHVYEIKMLMIAATALRLRGWRIVVLGRSRSAARLYRYCRAFGVHEIVPYDEFELDHGDRQACDREAARLLALPVLDLYTVKEWSFRGAWIGPQILSTVSRTRLDGAPDPSDPQTRADIEAVLPRMLRDVCRAERVIASLQPQLAIAREINYAVKAPLVDVAIQRGIDIVTVDRMWRDDAIISKRITRATRRMHPASLAAESLKLLSVKQWTPALERALGDEFAARYSGKRKLQFQYQSSDVRPYGREEFMAALNLDPTRKTAVVFSHVLWDANLFYGEDLFENFGDWLVQTVRAATQNPRLQWIIKLHPANLHQLAYHGTKRLNEVELIQRHIGDLPSHVKLLYPESEISTLSIYQYADYGITVRGTPGMEMACFGKSFLTAGTGRYSGLGFTVDSESREQYLERLAHLESLPPLDEEATRLAKWHTYGVFRLRQWVLKSFRPEFRNPGSGWHPLEHNFNFVARELHDLDDLQRWGAWAGESTAVDYMENVPS